jgi:hypothetical protein
MKKQFKEDILKAITYEICIAIKKDNIQAFQYTKKYLTVQNK